MQHAEFRSEHLLVPAACVLLFLIVVIAALWKLQKSEAARDESKLLGSYKTQALDDGRMVRRSTRTNRRPSDGPEGTEETTPANTPAKRTRNTPAKSEAPEPISTAKEPKSPRGRATRSAKKPERGKSPGRPRSVSRGRQRKEKA